MLMIVGLSAVALAHASSRTTVASRDWQEAGILARSALELTTSVLNATPNWRTTLRHGQTLSFTIEGARASVSLYDETDADFTNNTSDPIRLYATVVKGPARRIYSVLLTPDATLGLDALRCALHSDKDITSEATASFSNGPLSANGKLTNSATITGDAEITGTLTSSGSINGLVTNPAPRKDMPAAGAYSPAFTGATSLGSVTMFTGRTLGNMVLSNASNPYGIPNANGIYSISVPPLTTLTISRARLKASLLVTLQAVSARLLITDAVLWEPADATRPALVVVGNSGGQVDFQGSTTSLSEATASANFNPPGTPYNSVSNTTTTDTYPAQLRGLFHIVGQYVIVNVNTNANIAGCILSDAPVSLKNTISLTADPLLYSSPPTGYSSAATPTLRMTPGTFRWETIDNKDTLNSVSNDASQAPRVVNIQP